MNKLLLPATLIVAVAIAISLPFQRPANAQSSSRYTVPYGSSSIPQSGSSVRQPMMQRPATFEQKLWSYLQTQKYKNWAPVPGKSDQMYEGSSPHGAYLKMYLNRTAAGNTAELPAGSIIVKENYGADQKSLMAVTVMYKVDGYNPAAGDWYWVKYNPSGTVAQAPPEMNSVLLKGKPAGCIKCHGEGAGGGDFAFMND